MTERVISDSRLIPAPPSAIFTLLSDASQHGTFDGSDTVKGARASGPVPLQLGTNWNTAVFPAVYRMAGYLEAHPRNIAASLERLEQLFSKD